MKKQITFISDYADSKAIDWLKNLSECFNIKSAKITEIKQKRINYWRGKKKFRLEVTYD